MLQHQQGNYAAAHGEGKGSIGVDAAGSADIVPMVQPDGLHDGGEGQGRQVADLLFGVFHEVQEVVLKVYLVGPVLIQVGGEDIVVGVCKGVSGVVDQLAHGVVVEQTVLALSL